MKLVFVVVLSLLGFSFAAYETCADVELLTDIELTIARDHDNQMAKLTITGPSTEWFGFGIGNSKMNGMYTLFAIISLHGHVKYTKIYHHKCTKPNLQRSTCSNLASYLPSPCLKYT